MDSSPETDTKGKKTNIEDLNKEQLILKCQHLLKIAQKAKEAKDDANKQCKAFKEELDTLKSSSNKTQQSTLNDAVTLLTSQKAALMLEIDHLKTLKNEEATKAFEEITLLKKNNEEMKDIINRMELDQKQFEEEHLKNITEYKSNQDSLQTRIESLMKKHNEKNQENAHLKDEMEYLLAKLKTTNEGISTKNNELAEIREQLEQTQNDLVSLTEKYNLTLETNENRRKLVQTLEEKSKQEINLLKEKLANCKEILQSITSENEDKVTQLECLRDQMQTQKNEYDQKISNLQQLNGDLEKRLVINQDDLKNAKYQNSINEEELIKIKEQLKLYTAEECSREKNIDLLSTQVQMNSHTNNFNNKIDKLENEKNTIQIQLNKAISEKEELLKKLDESKNKLQELEKIWKEKQTFDKEKEEMNEKLNREKEEIIEILSKDKVELKEKWEKEKGELREYFNKEKEGLEEKLTREKEEINFLNIKLQAEINEYNSQLNTLLKSKEELKSEMNKISNEKLYLEDSIQTQIKEWEKNSREFSEKIQNLESEKNDVSNMVERIQKENQDLKFIINQLENEKQINNEENDKKKQDHINLLNKQNTEYKQALEKFQKEKEESELRYNHLLKSQDEIKSIFQEKIEEKKIEFINKLDELTKENNDLTNSLNSIKNLLKTVSKNNEENLEIIINNIKREKKEFELKINELIENIDFLEKELSIKNENYEKLTRENSKINSKIKTMQKNHSLEMEKYQNDKNKLEKQNEELSESNIQLKKNVEDLNIKFKKELENKNLKFSEILEQKEKEIKDKEISIQKYSSETQINNNNTIKLIKNLQQQIFQLKSNYVSLKQITSLHENGLLKEQYQRLEKAIQSIDSLWTAKQNELLKEMNDMNQELKQRGETISMLKELSQGLEQKLKAKESLLATITEQLHVAERDLETSKQKQAEELKKEISFNESTAASDALSTSTVSRAEEATRLSEIDDSFEEKYYKLKSLALRLKKRKVELEKELETERAALRAALASKNSDNTDGTKGRPKHTVLSLEIEVLEKQLTDITEKLSNEEKRSKQLEAELEEQKKIASECSHLNEMLAVSTNRIAELTRIQVELSEQLDRAQTSTERAQIEAADVGKQLTDIRQQLGIAIQRHESLQIQNTQLNSELSSTKQEFEQYKAKAKAVLAKRQAAIEAASVAAAEAEATKYKKTNEELEDLRNKESSAKKTLQEMSSEFENLKAEHRDCNDLRNQFKTRIGQLETLVSSLRNRQASLNDDHEEIVNRLERELVEAQKENSRLTKELNELEALQESQQISLQNTIQIQNESLATNNDNMNKDMPTNISLSDSSKTKKALSSTSSKTPPRVPIPLEQLLADQESSFLDTSLIQDEDNNIPPDEQTLIWERRERHLTALLNESERDTARLSQLNTALKAEIRRLNAALPPEEQTQNNNHAYLKNVVFKFIMLRNGDERVRLVPVLTQLLDLNRDDTERLLSIAKGEESLTGTLKSYLPSWPL